MNSYSRLKKIKSDLNFAKKANFKPFGVGGHNWNANKPLNDDEIEKIEQMYSITFPDEYRDYLLCVGNGGVGPAYGLLTVKEAIKCYRETVPADILSTPFEHIEYFNPDKDPYWNDLDAKCEQGIITEKEFDQLYMYIDSGTIAVCHEGCGHMHRLVISGPDRGNIWIDSSGSGQGYIPLKVSFLTWYENWLSQVLSGKSGTWWFDEN